MVGRRREGIKAEKQKGFYKKQIAKHKHQSLDRSRNRKLNSQEMKNASMGEKIVSLILCIFVCRSWRRKRRVNREGNKDERRGRHQMERINRTWRAEWVRTKRQRTEASSRPARDAPASVLASQESPHQCSPSSSPHRSSVPLHAHCEETQKPNSPPRCVPKATKSNTYDQ